MKFLCVGCDAPMALRETRGPDRGALTIVYGCPTCGHETALLINPMEAQMVRGLGVQVGGRTTAAEPMEMVRSTLAHQREASVEPAPAPKAGGKCPFTGMAEEAFAATDGPEWTPEAEARLERIPAFVRPMVRRSIEQHAAEHGHARIDGAVVDEVRGTMGM